MALALTLGLSGALAAPAPAAPSASDLQKKIDKASDDFEDVVEAHNKLREDLRQTAAAEKALAASLQPAREQLAAANAQVGTIAAAAYKVGRVSAVNAVLDGQGTLTQRLGLLEELSRNRQRHIAVWTETTQQYDTKKAALHSTRLKQTAQMAELTARKKKIQADLKTLYALRTAAYGRATEPGRKYTGSVPSVAGSAGSVVRYAYQALGTPYAWGADGPDGYDCSGLTSAAWRTAGKSLPHNAAAQYNATSRITRAQLVPGDLVFYRNLGHVGIYVGGGQIIDASRAGQPVKKRSINIMPPYGYGRVR